MDEMKYIKIGEANGFGEASIVESLLEAEGIEVELIRESISQSAYAMPFAAVQVFVLKEKERSAREFLRANKITLT
jgi:hypothetical protein